jgi:hypothetical protein
MKEKNSNLFNNISDSTQKLILFSSIVAFTSFAGESILIAHSTLPSSIDFKNYIIENNLNSANVDLNKIMSSKNDYIYNLIINSDFDLDTKQALLEKVKKTIIDCSNTEILDSISNLSSRVNYFLSTESFIDDINNPKLSSLELQSISNDFNLLGTKIKSFNSKLNEVDFNSKSGFKVFAKINNWVITEENKFHKKINDSFNRLKDDLELSGLNDKLSITDKNNDFIDSIGITTRG